jgi:phospholipid/cholesterol/gamma-HCH transport system substrate-binding protein
MITRVAKVQVLVFAVVSLLGIAFVGLRYVGLGDSLLGRGYLLHADFAVAGGIFPNAPVTYRGVPVGRVGAVRLHAGGVRVDLRMQGGVRVPGALHAVVAERSAVGEQYLDLRPDTDTGPYLRDGDVIPASRTGTPLPAEDLLAGLDALVRSVNPDDLRVLIEELGTAFENNESALRRILDSSDLLLRDATRFLPETLALIRDGRTVLSTQEASADAIRRWAAALADLTGTLRAADPDLRRLLANGPPAARQVIGLLRDLNPTIGTLLGNLVTVGGIGARRLPGIEQILVEYPLVVTGGFTVAPGDGTAHFGLVVNLNNPPACQYQQTGQRRCTAAERARGSGVRGSSNAPGASGAGPSPAPVPGGQPPDAVGQGASASGGATVAGYDPATGLVLGPDGQPLQLGGTGGQYQLAGEQSWKQLLLAGLAS